MGFTNCSGVLKNLSGQTEFILFLLNYKFSNYVWRIKFSGDPYQHQHKTHISWQII